MTPPNAAPSVSLSSLAWRASGFALLWCVLAETQPGANWPLALVVIVAAVYTSRRFRSGHQIRLRPWRILQFIPWFLGQSWRGGIDVANRALSPRMPLRTGFIDLRWQAPPGLPRVTLIWILNLLPGTAAVQAGDEHLRVHVLDTSIHTPATLADLERRVAALFHLP